MQRRRRQCSRTGDGHFSESRPVTGIGGIRVALSWIIETGHVVAEIEGDPPNPSKPMTIYGHNLNKYAGRRDLRDTIEV